jgi:hypothetical protein
MQKKLKISHHKLTCPHCRQNLKKEWLFICTTNEYVKYIYMCSHCKEVIGIFNNKLNKTAIKNLALN